MVPTVDTVLTPLGLNAIQTDRRGQKIYIQHFFQMDHRIPRVYGPSIRPVGPATGSGMFAHRARYTRVVVVVVV